MIKGPTAQTSRTDPARTSIWTRPSLDKAARSTQGLRRGQAGHTDSKEEDNKRTTPGHRVSGKKCSWFPFWHFPTKLPTHRSGKSHVLFACGKPIKVRSQDCAFQTWVESEQLESAGKFRKCPKCSKQSEIPSGQKRGERR